MNIAGPINFTHRHKILAYGDTGYPESIMYLSAYPLVEFSFRVVYWQMNPNPDIPKLLTVQRYPFKVEYGMHGTSFTAIRIPRSAHVPL